MLKLVKLTLYVFICIVAASAGLAVAGLAYLWFFSSAPSDLPYLGWLLANLIGEVIVVIIMLASKGLRYLPHVENHKEEKTTLEFMRKFIAGGSTVQIVSSRLAWINNSPDLASEMRNRAQGGALVEVITPNEVAMDVRGPLADAGVRFFVTREGVPPEARFTLVNGNRSGAERLAIARGSHPDHEVTVFDNNSGPQIIGMAKDIVRKSKELAGARSLG